MEKLFADVILPLPLHDRFTYRVPPDAETKIGIGHRVVVQFGAKKFYSALVANLHNNNPEGYETKEIESLLDDEPVICPENIRLWEWIASYYCCTLGDVMKAALPSGKKLESQSKVEITISGIEGSFSDKENKIIEALEEEPGTIDSLQKKLGRQFSFAALKHLQSLGFISVEEKISEKYKPKTRVFISLHPSVGNENLLNECFSLLKKAKKQEQLLLHFCHLAQPFTENGLKEISRNQLLEAGGSGDSQLKELVAKKILKTVVRQVSRLPESNDSQGILNLLNPFQEKALSEIKQQFAQKQVVLLHGVTSSGKTEIYAHLIRETIEQGKQVLYLVPEIALTAQLINRLCRYFPGQAGIYHSKLNDQERVEVWDKVLNFKPGSEASHQVVLGARSAIFLPFRNLGLIIVDEEHENTFKQFDPAPRYNARDMAVVEGSLSGCNVLLGSATPSFETYYNVKTGKYGYVCLSRRHGGIELPDVLVADIQRAYKRKEMKSFLTPALYAKITESLARNEQIILFQNRRGYSPFVECTECGWVPKCTRCDVSLTYHKMYGQLTCHYCGYSTQVPSNCPQCGSDKIKTRGMGTEKIEDELKLMFPEARVARMDLDSTKGKYAFEKLVAQLETRKIDILAGTQMVAKGLDFDQVGTVGILNADNLINFPDFRAHERCYQLISQVSGRAGRKYKQGIVVIQTSQPGHPIISEIQRQAFAETFARQMEERKQFNYPPFCRMIKITVKHRSPEKLGQVAGQLASRLRQENFFTVLGPEYPLISRIKLWHMKEIWLKIGRDNMLGEAKLFLLNCIDETRHLEGNSGAVFSIDVDPA